MTYFVIGPVAGTPYTRYGVLRAGLLVDVLVSVPDGEEVPRPASLRRSVRAQEVQIKSWRINEQPVSHNGEQPRRTTWRRAGRTAAKDMA